VPDALRTHQSLSPATARNIAHLLRSHKSASGTSQGCNLGLGCPQVPDVSLQEEWVAADRSDSARAGPARLPGEPRRDRFRKKRTKMPEEVQPQRHRWGWVRPLVELLIRAIEPVAMLIDAISRLR
jgi:hypothetical protein